MILTLDNGMLLVGNYWLGIISLLTLLMGVANKHKGIYQKA